MEIKVKVKIKSPTQAKGRLEWGTLAAGDDETKEIKGSTSRKRREKWGTRVLTGYPLRDDKSGLGI